MYMLMECHCPGQIDGRVRSCAVCSESPTRLSSIDVKARSISLFWEASWGIFTFKKMVSEGLVELAALSWQIAHFMNHIVAF